MKHAHFGIWVPIGLCTGAALVLITTVTVFGKQLQYLLSPATWSWPHALITSIALLVLPAMFFAARIESWHQRRARQRAANAWADPERRILFARQDFKGKLHGR